MDNEFYKNLMDRQKREEIGQDELEHLVEEHLDKVDEFRSRLEEMVKRKRKERREMLRGRRKKSQKVRQIMLYQILFSSDRRSKKKNQLM